MPPPVLELKVLLVTVRSPIVYIPRPVLLLNVQPETVGAPFPPLNIAAPLVELLLLKVQLVIAGLLVVFDIPEPELVAILAVIIQLLIVGLLFTL